MREARLDEVDAVIATLVAAFVHGDFASWLIPDVAKRSEVYPQYFRIFAEFFIQHGQVDVTDDCQAVALWWPVSDYLNMDIPDYDERLAKVTGDAIGRFVMMDLAMQSHHPQFRPHHYLSHIAVHPERQREGLASALLRHRLAELDQQGVPASLEATGIRTRAIYEHFGFRLTYPIDIPNGPTVYPMWRVAGGHAR